MDDSRVRAPWRKAALGLAVAVLLALGWERLTRCPIATVAGVPCPSCGMTRANLAMLRGAWREALSLHPLWIPVDVAVAAAALDVSGLRSERTRRYLRAYYVAVAVAAVALWLVRFAGWFGGPVPLVV